MVNDFNIVLIGRQNVGKSTLFNRLIKSRKAIIDSYPGVTRDLVYGNIEINNKKIRLIDSGGISDDKDITNQLVQIKTKDAQINADFILFIVEAGNPIPIEEEFLDFIRKKGKKVLIVVNKCDSPEKDQYINDYYAYGLGEPLPISAQHNRNIDLLIERIDEEIKNIYFENQDKSEDHDIKITIIGKPNVGKSSLLNKIVNKERSIVSSFAGTTRDIIDEEILFQDKKILLLDTAGIRKKKKVQEDIEYYSVNRAIKSISQADITLLIIDSVDNISDQDKKICDQIVKNGKGLIVVLNKWDLIKQNNINILDVKKDLIYKFPILQFAPIIPVSAKTGQGVQELLKQSIIVYDELHKRIDTSMINEFIQNIVKQYAPSSKKGVLKIYYGSQTGTSPVEFVFFINKKSLLSNNYKQYISNRIREEFGFKGIPLKIVFRDKKN